MIIKHPTHCPACQFATSEMTKTKEGNKAYCFFVCTHCMCFLMEKRGNYFTKLVITVKSIEFSWFKKSKDKFFFEATDLDNNNKTILFEEFAISSVDEFVAKIREVEKTLLFL